jgi:peptidoglycan/xylan/chitin deacetylase (PgdA/CDA1 family)
MGRERTRPRATWWQWLACIGVIASFCAAWMTVGPARPAHADAPKTVVSLTFDDADVDQMTAAQILHSYGLHGTFYIITSAIGTPTYMTRNDLTTLAGYGNEIGDHTVSHLSMPKISVAEARRQICEGKNILTGWGFPVSSFAYPDATYNRAVEQVARGCGLNSARIGNGLSNGQCENCAPAETLPPRDPDAVRTPGQIDTTWTVKAMEHVVVNAEHNGGGWVPFVFHHICTNPSNSNCSNLSITPAHFAQFARWLKSYLRTRGSVETVHQAVGGPVRADVPTAKTSPHGLENPSLAAFGPAVSVSTENESTNNVNGPSCWMYGGYGQNSVQWDRTPAGYNGRWAEQATMTSHTSGDAKLLQQFDLGQCSLPVTPGQAYQLSSWYTSTIPTQYAVYYRTAAGRWVYWTSSPYFQQSSRWANAVWQTPPVPPGASGLSFGLDLLSQGSLKTSDYGFQKPPVKAGVLAFRIIALLVACALIARVVYTRGAPITRAITTRSRRVARHIADAWGASARSSSNP